MVLWLFQLSYGTSFIPGIEPLRLFAHSARGKVHLSEVWCPLQTHLVRGACFFAIARMETICDLRATCSLSKSFVFHPLPHAHQLPEFSSYSRGSSKKHISVTQHEDAAPFIRFVPLAAHGTGARNRPV